MIKTLIKSKKLYIFLSVLLVAVFCILELSGKTSFILENRKSNMPQEDAKTTSTLPTAQSSFTDGDSRVPANTSNTNEGVVTDTQGGSVSPAPESQWSVSSTGFITVYSPARSGVLKTGDTLSGKASTPSVSFRLIDDVSGVIAEGRLSVKDGMFSGKFDFSTSGTEGRLDIFSTLTNGKEENNIEIPVRFK